MEVRVKDWNNVIDVEPYIRPNTYGISIVFTNGEVMSYGYNNKDRFLEDYGYIMSGKILEGEDND